MFAFFKKMFIESLRFSGSLGTKCMSFKNYQCKRRSFLINLDSAEFKYYSFMIPLDKCNESCRTLSEIFGRICMLNKIQDLNVFNLIIRTNDS